MPALPEGLAPSDQVAVVLASGTSLPPIACDGSWQALGRDGREVGRGHGLDADQTRVSASGVVLDGRSLGPPPIELRPTGSARMRVGGKAYRGSLVLERASGGGARLVNRLSVEDYLLGVVASEMPERFGLEALKAQAVAARSYALASVADQGRLYADTRSQVYGGVSAETQLSARAVRETNGQILTGGDGPLIAWYHSTCGGRTRPAREVFGQAPARVMDREVVCADCRNSPMYSWQRRIAAERVCSAMDLPSGRIDMAGVGSAALPGWPERLFVRSGARSSTLSMEAFRSRLSSGHALKDQVPSTRLASAPRVEGGDLVLDGHGWGHGVGMCQYGAAGFAARGGDYRSILRRYYPGADLMRMP
jgi:stage II sporulation protein D